MAPGITFDKQVFACLKENLELELEFNEDTKGLEVKVMFDGYTEPVAQETVYLDHLHNRRDLDI